MGFFNDPAGELRCPSCQDFGGSHLFTHGVPVFAVFLWGCAPCRVGYLRRSLSLSTGIWVRCTCDCKFPIVESGLRSDCLDL